MSTDEIVGRKLGGFELRDVDGELWSPERLQGRRAILFCFATW